MDMSALSALRDCTGSSREPTKVRLAWIDTLKSLGILFVIYGHAPGLTKGVETYLFSFHMPLFFFISGIFHASETDKTLCCYAAGRALRRLVPYLFFGLFTYLVWLVVTRHFGHNVARHVNPALPLLGLLYGTSWGDLLAFNGPLWFLPCLWVTEILFEAVSRRFASLPRRILAIAACGLIGVGLPHLIALRLPLSADVALVAVVFYGSGALARQRLLTAGRLPLPWLAAIGAVSIPLALANGKVSMDGVWYSHNVWLFFLDAGLGILFWSEVARRLAGVLPWLAELGRHTMVLFCLHFLAFACLSGLLTLVLHIPLERIRDTPLAAPAYTLWAVLLLLPLSRFLAAHAPFLVGQRAQPPAAPRST